MQTATSDKHSKKPNVPAAAFGFVGLNGAEIQLQNSAVPHYACVRAEQIEVLSDLVASKAAGFQITLSENDTRVLSMLAMEFSHEMNQLMNFMAELPEPGGA